MKLSQSLPITSYALFHFISSGAALAKVPEGAEEISTTDVLGLQEVRS
jgi:hypothetical protein